jgi:hypothetical protein
MREEKRKDFAAIWQKFTLMRLQSSYLVFVLPIF